MTRDEALSTEQRSMKRLVDVLELTELTYRYASALDSRNWAAMAELFTADATFDYGLGPDMVMSGRDVFIQATAGAMANLDATHHMFSNHLFDIDGNHASGRYYMHAQHLKLGAPAGALHTIGGFYDEQFVRTDTGWQVSDRVYVAVWGRGNGEINPGFRTDTP